MTTSHQIKHASLPWYVRAVGLSLVLGSVVVSTVTVAGIFDLTLNSIIVLGTVFGVAGVVGYACAGAADDE